MSSGNKGKGPDLTPEEIEDLRKIVRGSEEKLRAAEIFISLYSKNMAKDPVPIMQLGMAIMLNKPIYVVACEGVEVPEQLRKIAILVEPALTPKDAGPAVEKILKHAESERK